MTPRYPEVHIRLHSHNPYALISAVRLALRRSHVEADEIQRFTAEAMSGKDAGRMFDVCASWASVEFIN